jgi:LL-diaminopimelate aminotransferase
MALVNEHFLKLPNNYLFADIAKKVNAFKVMHPKADVISSKKMDLDLYPQS